MKRVVFLIGIVLFFSCQEKNTNTPPSVPQLISPMNTETVYTDGYSKQITFSWENSYDPDNDLYQYTINMYSENSNGYNSSTENHVLNYIPIYGKFYWRVKAEDKNGNSSEYSDTWVINIINLEAPPTPELILPVENSMLETNEVHFEWTNVIDPQGDPVEYDFFIDTFPEINTFGWNPLFKNDTNLILDFNKKYYWKVRAVDDKGNQNEFSSIGTFYIGESTLDPPSIPNLLFPLNGNNCSDYDLTFDWDESTDPQGETITYDLCIDTVSSFNGDVHVYSTSNSEYHVTLEEGTPYYWKVRARNYGAMSEYSNTWSLFTKIDGNQNTVPFIEYISPENNTTINGSSVTLTWQGSDVETNNSNLIYKVYFAEDNDDFLLVQEGNETQRTVNGLNSGVTYKWQVSVTDEDNATTIGEIWRFTVQ